MLYLIATPIGNLKDITLRGIETLEKVDYLLCEDTRVTSNLLHHLHIRNKPELISFYDEVEAQKIPQVIKLLEQNKQVGLVTDAGTPIISDPGYLLIQKCQKLGIKYTAIPGASALLTALTLSGFPSGRFIYLGFLPKKSTERIKLLFKYKSFSESKVVYESPLRLAKLIEDLKNVYGEDKEVCICRELTKKFETIIRDTISHLLKSKLSTKGELTIIF